MVMDSAPSWLNNEFLEKALNSREENDVKVVSSEITKATAPGDNYGSEIYRAVVQILKNGVLENKSLIVKAELTDIEMKRVISEGNAFEKEINAYNLAISNLDRILTECALKKYQPYAAKCYYTYIGEPASVLVLEDLKESGFRLANPSRGLDLKHCFIAVNTLAIYHAASTVLYAKYPEKIEPFKTGIYRENMRANLEKMFKPVLKQLALEAENWPECKGVIAKKLRDIESELFDHLMACVKTDDKTFNVLCHEDCWLNNIMFRYSEETNQITDVRFLDFQACHWTSPAIDLLYFINATAAPPIVKRPYIIIDEYYRTLYETLNTLGYGHFCPSKNDICNQFEKRHKFGVIIGCILRYVMFVNRNAVPDMEKILKNEVQCMFSETYRNDMREILPAFHQRGWL